MTDYPTRAEIDAANDTLVYLYNRTDQRTLLASTAARALLDAARILDALDDVPGLHYPATEPESEPEPEPKPTAAEVLDRAFERMVGLELSAEMQIIGAAVTYAEAHPEWFANWHNFHRPEYALGNAAHLAYGAGNLAGQAALRAAVHVAKAHPDLFGGAS